MPEKKVILEIKKENFFHQSKDEKEKKMFKKPEKNNLLRFFFGPFHSKIIESPESKIKSPLIV